ncbi:hypothetical protein [uncultured Desulfobulbus sp.]|uniref:hypothetical protein n=1 Tax=uncultured Desulfobulbus sp. TaxID=239745 RepID=UPI0029C76EEA|nr:hypothetical protein [uncultured Desulfobulbus sp.]
MTTSNKKKPTWTDLKRNLADLDQHALLGLVQDLYAASKENKVFLHARFGMGDDVLEPYKATISRWVCPDVMRNQDYSVSKAKKAISDYKKAVGHSEGLAELSVLYCESCRDFLGFCSVDDEGFFNALVRMFEQALKCIRQLDAGQQEQYLERLDSVHYEADDWGWGVGEDMDDLMAEYGFGKQ